MEFSNEELTKYVDDNCRFKQCKNRDTCISKGYICPAATIIMRREK